MGCLGALATFVPLDTEMPQNPLATGRLSPIAATDLIVTRTRKTH